MSNLRKKIQAQKKEDGKFKLMFRTGHVHGPLPQKRYYGYDIIREYSLDEILPLIPTASSTAAKEAKAYLPGHHKPITVGSDRLIMYKTKGVKCVTCPRTGHVWRLEENHGNGAHLNLYTIDGRMMTKDHIHPKSLGGKDVLDNYQPMCDVCNKNKGNKV